MSMPIVSAVIPAYNAAKYLRQAIESVFAQTYTDWEIVLVDDGSTDNTRAVVQPYLDLAPERFQYIYQENQGLPAARNEAIRNARGRFLALLDADDIWKPDRLMHSVTVLEGRPDIGLVHGKVARIDSEGRFIDVPPADRGYLEGDIAHYIYTRRAHIQCPTVTFRKECVEVLGGFDPAIPGTADRDLWFRISERYKVGFVDEVLASYRMSSDSMSHDLNRMRAWQVRFVRKHYGSRTYRRGAFRLAMASIYREQGDLLFKSDRLKALKDYAKAALYNPLNRSNVYMLLRALAKPF
jgi:glycosyltransferase involved in cell wall biosynthesis